MRRKRKVEKVGIFSMRLPVVLIRQIDAIADSRRLSRNQAITEAVEEYCKKGGAR